MGRGQGVENAVAPFACPTQPNHNTMVSWARFANVFLSFNQEPKKTKDGWMFVPA